MKIFISWPSLLFFILLLTGCGSKSNMEEKSEDQVNEGTVFKDSALEKYPEERSVIDNVNDSDQYVSSATITHVLLEIVKRKEPIDNFINLAVHAFKDININELSVQDKCNLQIFCFYFANEIGELKKSENHRDQEQYQILTDLFEKDFSVIFVENSASLQSDLNNEESILAVGDYLVNLTGEPGKIARENLMDLIEIKNQVEESNHPIRCSVMHSLYYKNEIKARQMYPMGRYYYVSIRIRRVVIDETKGYNYCVYCNGADLYTDDHNFIDINYPMDVIIKGLLVGKDNMGELLFKDVTLIKSIGYNKYDDSKI